MRTEVREYVDRTINGLPPGEVIDVGSFDVNGHVKDLFVKRGWKYTGLDMKAGKNVDVVCTLADAPKVLNGKQFDCVSCLETIEHVYDPVAFTADLKKLLKPGGLLILCTPGNGFATHRFPVDCWRLLPDVVTWLLNDLKDVSVLETSPGTNAAEVYAKGRKP